MRRPGGRELRHPLAADPEGQFAPGATVRLSIGIEHIDDILADLDQALKAAASREIAGQDQLLRP